MSSFLKTTYLDNNFEMLNVHISNKKFNTLLLFYSRIKDRNNESQ